MESERNPKVLEEMRVTKMGLPPAYFVEGTLQKASVTQKQEALSEISINQRFFGVDDWGALLATAKGVVFVTVEDEFGDDFEDEVFEHGEEEEEDDEDGEREVPAAEALGSDGVHAEVEGRLWRAGDSIPQGERHASPVERRRRPRVRRSLPSPTTPRRSSLRSGARHPVRPARHGG